ncbi:sensor domain-containing diguanylate cyclase [Devosia sp.]|uniref:sensor domain-containing diguanylate cyclase n=1 Tax=Devosia sp. TaxID=1871048 RepID=UPI003BACCC1F
MKLSGLAPPTEPLIAPMPVRSRMLSIATVLLVAAVIAAAIFGFVNVSSQQQALTALREQGQELSTVNQALVEADANVLHYLAGEPGALPGFYANLELLRKGRAGLIGTLEAPASAAGSGVQSVGAIIDGLDGVWSEAIRLTTAGNSEAGRVLLSTQKTGEAVSVVGDAVQRVLNNADIAFRGHDERIWVGTLFVLMLQVIGGGLAILGLVYAFRSSVSEADGRAAAVASADASREQVARLFEMADVLQSATDHADANAVLKATAAELVPGFSGALYVFNNSRDRLVLSTDWERPAGERLPETISPADCWALKRGKPHLNQSDSGRLCCAHHAPGETLLEIPMIARGEIVGLLQLFASGADAEARLEAVTNLGSALADGMSLALANMALREKLRNQALRDPLTGLYNRRYMEDSLQRFVRLAERENREVSLVMVDLDHFKRLNDEHGHAFGDQVLRESALALVSALRETDIVCRYGGEELVVILPDCPIERAAEKAEALRLRIESLSSAHGAEITASFGVASIPHTSNNITDLLASADAALYKAKESGRNCVVTAPLKPFRLDRPAEDSGAESYPRVAAE